MTFKKFLQTLPLLVALIPTFAVPIAAHAAVNNNVWDPTILKGPLVTCVGASTSTLPVQQTCADLCDLVGQVAHVIYFMIAVVIWILTPIFVVWAGILFIMSRGSTEMTGQARKMIRGLVIGLAIALCAYIIIHTFVSVLNIAGIGGFSNPACSFSS